VPHHTSYGYPYRHGRFGGVNRPTDNTELRQRLLGVKLKALVGDHLGTAVDAEPSGFRSGSGLVVDGRAWVLIDGDASRSLGPAIAWAIRHDAESLDLIAETATGLLARRAGYFSFPISVWFAEDRLLLPVVAEPHAPLPAARDEHTDLIATIEAGGAEPCIEHGVVTGEVRGLEVCRVVDEPTIGRLIDIGEIELSGQLGEPGVRLEVGVGVNDREAFQLLHGDLPTVDALSGVVEAVRSHRSADAPQHPLNRMAPERFLRWEAVNDPARVDMVSVEPASAPVPRPSMKDQAPAVAVGVDDGGRRNVLVFSSGVDLDLVPFALDAHAALAAWGDTELASEITLHLRDNDLVAITRDLAEHAAVTVRCSTLN
jgi:hypothetical protein